MRNTESNHIIEQYDEELSMIRDRILQMGGAVESQLADALKSFDEQDQKLAGDVISKEKDVNSAEVGLDEECVSVIARRQPAAGDLRALVSAIKISTDLERIGDEASKIASMARAIGDRSSQGPYEQFESVRVFGAKILEMVRATLDAFARQDHVAALNIAKSDKHNDMQYRNALRSLITYMMEDPRVISGMLDTIWVLRALERIGDHSKNICEHTMYQVKGTDIRHQDLKQSLLQ